MKVWETKKDLEILRTQNRIYKQNCITQLVTEFRASYKKHEWIRGIIKFISRGRLCKLDQYSWSYEILEEVTKSFWYREIQKFYEFHENEINGMEYHLQMLSDTDDTPSSIIGMIRIIREVVTE